MLSFLGETYCTFDLSFPLPFVLCCLRTYRLTPGKPNYNIQPRRRHKPAVSHFLLKSGQQKTHPDQRIYSQDRSAQSPGILDLGREWFWELPFAELENDKELRGYGGQEDPYVLTHSDGASRASRN